MFKIGDFSKLSRVSIRMLRHYDRLRLLNPAAVDPQSGYRYYSAEQLPRLNRIVALKDLGFRLEQIAPLLEENVTADEMRGMLKLQRAQLEGQLDQDRARLAQIEARIEQIERGDAELGYDVIVRPIDLLQVATIRSAMAHAESISGTFEELEAYVAGHQARDDKPPLMISYDSDHRDRDWDVEVAVPVKPLSLQGDDRVRVRALPRVAQMACVVHQGSYARIHLASNALLSWIGTNDYQIDGPCREVYLRFGADQEGYRLPAAYLARDSNEFVTELQLPVVPR